MYLGNSGDYKCSDSARFLHENPLCVVHCQSAGCTLYDGAASLYRVFGDQIASRLIAWPMSFDTGLPRSSCKRGKVHFFLALADCTDSRHQDHHNQ